MSGHNVPYFRPPDVPKVFTELTTKVIIKGGVEITQADQIPKLVIVKGANAKPSELEANLIHTAGTPDLDYELSITSQLR